MKKLISITGVILIGCVVISVVFGPDTSAETTAEVYNQATIEQAYSQPEKFEDIYILKSENDEIVVYKKGEKSPLLIKKVSVESLPKGDILRLKDGIIIIGREKLRKALEDYCS